MNRRSVASIGDTLTIEVRDASGELIRILHHEIDAKDIRRAFTELILTPEDLQPRQTALLANYPNPLNSPIVGVKKLDNNQQNNILFHCGKKYSITSAAIDKCPISSEQIPQSFCRHVNSYVSVVDLRINETLQISRCIGIPAPIISLPRFIGGIETEGRKCLFIF